VQTLSVRKSKYPSVSAWQVSRYAGRDVIGYCIIEYGILLESPSYVSKVGGRSDWRTMIRGTNQVVIAQERIAAGIPTTDSAVSVMLLIISASVKTSHRLQ
jgi:hypothetical protein